MYILKYVLLFTIVFSLSACVNKNAVVEDDTEYSDLQLDHFNIWVKNPAGAKKILTDIGFTAIPDSLCKIHHGQGTSGRYFYFLNTYLEFIFVYDQVVFEKNAIKNKDIDFIERSNFITNGASPFSLAFQIKDYETDKIPFEKVRYHQDWMEENNSIYSAKTSKTNLFEPSVFVVYPTIKADIFNSMEDLNKIPEEYALWREFYKHPNGAEKLTKIEISSKQLDLTSKTISTVNRVKNVTVKEGVDYLMELHFDYNIQNKTFDLRPGLPLIIHL